MVFPWDRTSKLTSQNNMLDKKKRYLFSGGYVELNFHQDLFINICA